MDSIREGPVPSHGGQGTSLRRRRDSFLSESPCLLAQLAVIPVQEKEGKGAHNQEKQDPHPEAGVVLDRLVVKAKTRTFKERSPEGGRSRWRAGRYLSYVLVALFDVFCSADHQLMNTVDLRFLSRQRDARLSTSKRAWSDRVNVKARHSLVAALSQQRSPVIERFQPPSPRSACRRSTHTHRLQSAQACLPGLRCVYRGSGDPRPHIQHLNSPDLVHQIVHLAHQPLVLLLKLETSKGNTGGRNRSHEQEPSVRRI